MAKTNVAVAPSDTVERILDVAEDCIRERGYNAFSFREIAKEIGIKSASVHYHFPTKADLGAAVVRRYTDYFIHKLGEPGEGGIAPRELLDNYTEEFRKVMARDQKMCIGGILGAEADSLPEEVVEATRHFFESNLEWLAVVLERVDTECSHEEARTRAFRMLAALEGALILARSLGETDAYSKAVDELLSVT